MSDHNQSETLRILKMAAHWITPARTGPAGEIIDKCRSVKLSDNPDAKEILELVRTWVEALEEHATGDSKEALKLGGEFLDDAIAREQPGASMSFDAAMAIFMAGLSGGPEVARQMGFVERRAETRARHGRIREAVLAEMQSGEHKNVTSARRAVAERMNLNLRTIQDATKNI